jgi:quercetin dioxygenase-like cupin family protein
MRRLVMTVICSPWLDGSNNSSGAYRDPSGSKLQARRRYWPRLNWDIKANKVNAVDIPLRAAITVFPGKFYDARVHLRIFEGRRGVHMKKILIMAVAVLIVGSGMALHVARAQQSGIKRTDLQRHDLSVPRREVVQVRVDFAPGAMAPKHSHPGEEIVYVIEGTLEYEVEGKPPVTLHPGEVLFVPAGTIHAAKNVGSGNGAELATYVVEKGKPLVVMAE